MRGVRSLWLPFAAVAYVCFAAAKAGGGYVPWLALVLLPLMLAEVWRRTAAPPQQGEDRIETHRALGATRLLLGRGDVDRRTHRSGRTSRLRRGREPRRGRGHRGRAGRAVAHPRPAAG